MKVKTSFPDSILPKLEGTQAHTVIKGSMYNTFIFVTENAILKGKKDARDLILAQTQTLKVQKLVPCFPKLLCGFYGDNNARGRKVRKCEAATHPRMIFITLTTQLFKDRHVHSDLMRSDQTCIPRLP